MRKACAPLPPLLGALALALASGVVIRVAHAETKVDKKPASTTRTVRKVPLVDQTPALQHPLWPALELAVDSYKHIRQDIQDYSCTLVRRERVGGVLQDFEYIRAKVRHRRTRGGAEVVPFSVYLHFLAPKNVQGREVLYVDGKNEGRMFVRRGGERLSFVKTSIFPDSDLAMQDNRYPVTEFGFENLVRRLMQVAKEDISVNAESKVDFFRNASVDGRDCTGIRVTHSDYDPDLRFYQAVVFMDNELKVPIHYEAYDWPDDASGVPVLLEQYTYRDIKLNVGFKDHDFEHTNPQYRLQ